MVRGGKEVETSIDIPPIVIRTLACCTSRPSLISHVCTLQYRHFYFCLAKKSARRL